MTLASSAAGRTEVESRPLLDFLTRHITQAGFSCRLHRETGDRDVGQPLSLIHI